MTYNKAAGGELGGLQRSPDSVAGGEEASYLLAKIQRPNPRFPPFGPQFATLLVLLIVLVCASKIKVMATSLIMTNYNE